MAMQLYYDPVNQWYQGSDGNQYFKNADGGFFREVSNGESETSIPIEDGYNLIHVDSPAAPAGANRLNSYLTIGADGKPQWRGIQGGMEGFYTGNTFNPAQRSEAGGGLVDGLFMPTLLAAGTAAVGGGASGLFGGAGNGLTLGSEFGAQGNLAGVLAGAGSASTGASAAAGAANMFDLGGGLSLDEFGNVTGGLFPTTTGAASAGGFDLGGGLSVDEFGNITGGLFQGGPGTAGAGDFFSGGATGLDFGNMGLKDILSGASSIKNLFGGGSPLAGLLKGLGIDPNGAGGSILNLAAREAPGIAALAYANSQPGIDTSGLEGILRQLGGNHDGVIRAATDPLQMNIASGYGDILQSQGLRGIRGSSFGDTDIGNYIATTGRSLANAGANAAEGSLSLQGNLAGSIAQLKNQAQTIKNNLFGKAFDIMGRGLNPTPTFNLAGA